MYQLSLCVSKSDTRRYIGRIPGASNACWSVKCPVSRICDNRNTGVALTVLHNIPLPQTCKCKHMLNDILCNPGTYTNGYFVCALCALENGGVSECYTWFVTRTLTHHFCFVFSIFNFFLSKKMHVLVTLIWLLKRNLPEFCSTFCCIENEFRIWCSDSCQYQR